MTLTNLAFIASRFRDLYKPMLFSVFLQNLNRTKKILFCWIIKILQQLKEQMDPNYLNDTNVSNANLQLQK